MTSVRRTSAFWSETRSAWTSGCSCFRARTWRRSSTAAIAPSPRATGRDGTSRNSSRAKRCVKGFAVFLAEHWPNRLGSQTWAALLTLGILMTGWEFSWRGTGPREASALSTCLKFWLLKGRNSRTLSLCADKTEAFAFEIWEQLFSCAWEWKVIAGFCLHFWIARQESRFSCDVNVSF